MTVDLRENNSRILFHATKAESGGAKGSGLLILRLSRIKRQEEGQIRNDEKKSRSTNFPLTSWKA